jgi:hypothetical protein
MAVAISLSWFKQSGKPPGRAEVLRLAAGAGIYGKTAAKQEKMR